MLIAEIMQYLDACELVTYDANDTSGDVFIELPATPDTCVAVLPQPGTQSPGYDNLDNTGVQIIVRGAADTDVETQARAQAIYDKTHGFRNGWFINGGAYILSCLSPNGGIVPLGDDDNSRPEFAVNLNIKYRNTNREVR
ncbi:minor capsid protein [bacterium]|nr:minor capsid protein [bacterium]